MKMNKFKIYLEYDPEFAGFIADVPSLPGCMSQGKTEKEALKNIQEAIQGYWKVLKKPIKLRVDIPCHDSVDLVKSRLSNFLSDMRCSFCDC